MQCSKGARSEPSSRPALSVRPTLVLGCGLAALWCGVLVYGCGSSGEHEHDHLHTHDGSGAERADAGDVADSVAPDAPDGAGDVTETKDEESDERAIPDEYPAVGEPFGTPYPYDRDLARDPNDVPEEPVPEGGTVTITAEEIPAYVAPEDYATDWQGERQDERLIYYAYGGGQEGTTQEPKVPGPFLRLKEGREVTVELRAETQNVHSIDFHAVVGQKGGAAVLEAGLAETASFTFVPKHPGIFVYHCVGDGSPGGIAHHINNGMFGLVLVEPASPEGKWGELLQEGADEFYVFQQDIYLDSERDDFDEGAMLAGDMPDHSVYNGRVGALFDHPLEAQKGRNAIIYYGAAGNHISSFHMIGEVFDWVFYEGDLVSPPKRHIQTTAVPSSGAVAVGLEGDSLVPTDFEAGDVNILVDHASDYLRLGAMGMMRVSE